MVTLSLSTDSVSRPSWRSCFMPGTPLTSQNGGWGHIVIAYFIHSIVCSATAHPIIFVQFVFLNSSLNFLQIIVYVLKLCRSCIQGHNYFQGLCQIKSCNLYFPVMSLQCWFESNRSSRSLDSTTGISKCQIGWGLESENSD